MDLQLYNAIQQQHNKNKWMYISLKQFQQNFNIMTFMKGGFVTELLC